jgi:hypothetical protein
MIPGWIGSLDAASRATCPINELPGNRPGCEGRRMLPEPKGIGKGAMAVPAWFRAVAAKAVLLRFDPGCVHAAHFILP